MTRRRWWCRRPSSGELLFGDATGGATGYLVGEENKGLQCMFIMMNELRFQVVVGDKKDGRGVYCVRLATLGI